MASGHLLLSCAKRAATTKIDLFVYLWQLPCALCSLILMTLPFEGAALSAAHPRGNDKLEVRFVQDTYTFQRLNQLFHRFIIRDFLFLLLPSVFLGAPRGIVIEIGRNKKQMQEYIKNQLTEDQIADQIGIKEFVDPFTGSVNQKA